nr:stage III sporulation protein SpoIIIAB [Lentibacillus sp. JNUCC-1]
MAGFDVSHRLQERPKHIRQLKNALQVLEAEILYSQLPLQDAFNMVAKQVPNPTGNFFASLSKRLETLPDHFGDLWEQELSQFMHHACINRNDREIMMQFGRTLGQHDFEQQQKHIYLANSHLDRELEEARDNQIRYAKLAKSLGVLFGLFIVLLLI